MPYIDLAQIRLHYEIHGRGDPILLIHGLGSSARDWELQLEDLSLSYRVITVDLRGHGLSDKPPGPYSIELFAEDCALLLSELKCTPTHILGISLGGMVAFQMGISFPQTVQSLVIVNSTPDLVPQNLQDRLWIWQRFIIIRLMGLRKLGEVLGNRFFPRPNQSELREIFIERWAENDKPAYLETMKAVVGWSVKERLGDITAPTLVVGADGDYFPTSEKEAYVKLIPDARLEIVKDTRHALPAEKPGVFNRLVVNFLKDLSI